jgi:hypothetical protein
MAHAYRAAALILCIAIACDRPRGSAGNDSADVPDSLRSDTTVVATRSRDWRPAAGRMLLVPTAQSDLALAVFPEYTADSSLTTARFEHGPGSSEYELYGADGSSVSSRLTNFTPPPPGCESWPSVRLDPPPASAVWSIGLQSGRAQAIPFTALARMTGRDSSRAVIELARLASQAPGDTIAALRGLPYVTRSAYMARLPDSQLVVFAELVRRLNVEANPVEERIVIIGERTASDVPYDLAFSERHTGDEESVPTTDLIGLVQLGDGRLEAFAARDFSEAGSFLMIERSAPGRWSLRWQSAYSGC